MTGRAENWLRFLLVALLLAAAKLFLHFRDEAERLPPREGLTSFPLRVKEWVGTDSDIDPQVREILGRGDFLSRIYRSAPHTPYIDLFLAYFPTQRTGSTIHSPQHCLPGAGWLPLEHSLVELTRPDGQTIRVNRYLIARGLERQLALYWYQAHGRVVASEYLAKFYLVSDAIRMNRSDGALVRVIIPLAKDESVEEGQRTLVEFTEELTPLLDRYIPR